MRGHLGEGTNSYASYICEMRQKEKSRKADSRTPEQKKKDRMAIWNAVARMWHSPDECLNCEKGMDNIANCKDCPHYQK